MIDQLIREWYWWDAMFTLSGVLAVLAVLAGIFAAVSVPVSLQCGESESQFKLVLRAVTLPLLIGAILLGIISALLPGKGATDLAKKHIEMRLEMLGKSVSESAESVSKNAP